MASSRPTHTQLRILILGNAAPYRIGGAEVQIRRLADMFSQLGHRVTIAGYAMPDRFSGTRPPWQSIRVKVHGSGRWRRAISFVIALSRLLLWRRRSYDVIYSRVIGESVLVAAVLKFVGLIRQPIIVSSACAGESGDAAALARLPGYVWFVRLLNRTCSAVNILSPQIEDELKCLGLQADLFTFIDNGVPEPDSVSRETHSFDGPRTFLYVGRLSRRKRVDLILRAVSRLKSDDRHTQLHIVGDGPERGQLSALAQRLNIADRVAFYGRISPQKVWRHYARHTFFILTSRDEGQPNALLEAMAHGMPVIVTASGGAEYIMDDTMGIVCPPEDPEALYDAMARLLTMPSERLVRMGNRAQQVVRSRYDLRQVARQYLELFVKTMRRAHPH